MYASRLGIGFGAGHTVHRKQGNWAELFFPYSIMFFNCFYREDPGEAHGLPEVVPEPHPHEVVRRAVVPGPGTRFSLFGFSFNLFCF